MFSDLHVLILNGGRDTFYYFFTKPSKTLGKTRSPIHVYLGFPRACTGKKTPFGLTKLQPKAEARPKPRLSGSERIYIYFLIPPPGAEHSSPTPLIVVEEMLTSSEERYCRWTPSASRPKSMFAFARLNVVSQCVVHAACCSLLSSRA